MVYSFADLLAYQHRMSSAYLPRLRIRCLCLSWFDFVLPERKCDTMLLYDSSFLLLLYL
jgi:hypothetical protein